MNNVVAVKAENLNISYREETVVKDVNVEIVPGSMTAIIGPNGAGKTTMLKGMLGLIPVDSGVTSFFGSTLHEMRKRIAYVPQKGMVNWDFPTTVRDVTVMGRYVHLGWIKRPHKVDYRKADEALEIMGMSRFAKRQISELSGGQKQRVFIARALCQEPDLFILDEPLQGVDMATEKTIVERLRELQKEGKTILAVHHNLVNVNEIFDHVVLIHRELIAQGPMEEAFNETNLIKAYGDMVPHLLR